MTGNKILFPIIYRCKEWGEGMLLTKIEITDFLSVRGKLPIDFDKKVTILLGANDHGKSNILSALEHLNEDTPITEDEKNWDATGVPAISFAFALGQEEIREWGAIVEKLLKDIEERSSMAADTQAEAPNNSPPPPTAQPASPTKTKTLSPPPKEPAPAGELPAAVLNPNATSMTLTRTGVGASLQFEGVDLQELPKEMFEFFKRSIPRVELFKALSGSLQDSTTATEIVKEEFEFLQGVFFYAGLDPRQCSELFTQNDRTMRVLDDASKKLDEDLRQLWGQGTDLHFYLRHKGNSIEFLANDPAVTTRVARMSKRSQGVTQFFRVSMVLNARRNKHEANSYIYLFDEPGVYLHPQGQRDLLQVFETLADENQIIYATHSLFLLNQNFPERHRLIYKDKEGTKVDQKPYRQNWKLATDSLGIYLTSNILFANKVLLVEGDSDPIFLYELLRQLNQLGEIDIDLNSLGIMSFYDYHNLRFLLQVFRREGQDTGVLLLMDGDSTGRAYAVRAGELCKRLGVPVNRLPEGRSIEDYCLFEEHLLQSVKRTLQIACEAEDKPVPKDLEERVKKSWEEHKALRDKPEKRDKTEKPENGEKDEKKQKITAGRWFKVSLVGDQRTVCTALQQ